MLWGALQTSSARKGNLSPQARWTRFIRKDGALLSSRRTGCSSAGLPSTIFPELVEEVALDLCVSCLPNLRLVKYTPLNIFHVQPNKEEPESELSSLRGSGV